MSRRKNDNTIFKKNKLNPRKQIQKEKNYEEEETKHERQKAS